MKLLTIYNVFDGEEFLACSVANIRAISDYILCMVQTTSNHGNLYQGGLNQARELLKSGDIDRVQMYDPADYRNAMWNETQKRNIGLKYAVSNGFTHVLNMDCDELFEPDELKWAVKEIEKHPKVDWWVCDIKAYFRKCNLTVGLDSTKMAFISKAGIVCGNYSGKYKIDPTRRFNSQNYEHIGLTMHHYSWVRNSIQRKIENSTARAHIERSRLLDNYNNAKEGSYVAHYDTTLQKCDIIFDCLKNI